MSQHRKLSPSAAHRWMNCFGSVNKIGDESSLGGPAAMRGTAAHKLIEVLLGIKKEIPARNYLGFRFIVKQAGDEETEMYGPDDEAPLLDKDGNPREGWFLFVCDEKMADGVQMMLDAVREAAAKMFQPTLYTERFLDGSWLDPRLGGTADCTLVEDFGWAHLFDYKNGFNLVDHKDNEQLKNYGVFILHEHPDIDGVRITIVQPNAMHEEGCVRTVEYTRDELKLFEAQMVEACKRVSMPNAPLRAGDWCTYCPAKIRCEEFEAKTIEEAGADFASDPIDELGQPKQLPTVDVRNTEDLARKARWVPLIDKWAREVEEAVKNELMSGKPVPGFKLVAKKSNRRWTVKPDELEEMLANAEGVSIAVDALYERKLLTPAKAEKLGTTKDERKAMKAFVATVCEKPNTGVTVADETDPRETVDPAGIAASDFTDDPIEDE